mgnify:CR=1 FL=1
MANTLGLLTSIAWALYATGVAWYCLNILQQITYVTLADGRVIEPDDVLGPPRPGACLAYTGDAGRIEGLEEYVSEADLLVVEATYLAEEAEMARAFGHLTATQAAHLACSAGAHRLALTHVSRRYRESDIVEEARRAFPDAVVVRDFDHFRVMREQVLMERPAG